MRDRLVRLEFSSLYELYLAKNNEFREAVRSEKNPAEIAQLRENINDIYGRLSEKRKLITHMQRNP